MSTLVRRFVSFYLRHVPLTEGKNRLYRIGTRFGMPANPRQTADIRHGFRLHLNLANPEHRRMFFYGDHDERYETALMKRIVAPGDTCWDVGANIGFYTCLFARLAGQAGRVCAIEPASRTRALLEGNIALNGYGNVTVIASAVSDHPGSAELYFGDADKAEGTASMIAGEGKSSSETVAVTTLDALAQSCLAPAVMKVDVEGLQREVLEGAQTLLARHRPLVVGEFKEASREAMKATQALAEGLGYRVFDILKRGLAPCPVLADSPKRNFLLAAPDSPLYVRVAPLLG